MTKQYSFRKAQRKEKAAIFNLYCRVMRPYIVKIWGWDQGWQEKDFDEHFEPDNIMVVSVGNELVGYSQVEDQGDNLFIRMLLLLPEHQHRGLGSHLLKKVIESAKAQPSGITLQVFKVNEGAKIFYECHGFQVESETPSSLVMVFMPNNQVNKDASR